MITVGSDVSVHVTKTACTGIERVVRECHGDLHALLWAEGLDLVPIRLAPGTNSENYLSDLYLAADPVLRKPLRSIDDVDALIFLDLHHVRDFTRLYHARRERKLPTIFVIYDLLPLLSPQWFPPLHDRLFLLYIQQVLRTADHIVTISHKVADDLRSLGWRTSAQIHPLHLGSTFQPLPPPQVDHLSILYVSTLEPRKGHDTLLDAFDILLAEGEDVELTLVGREGWECSEVVRRILTHTSFGTRLHWFPSASDFDIRQLSRSCNVATMPSRDEGFGLFVEEAQSLGLKVVASNIPVFQERRGPNVTLCELGPESLAAGLVAAHAQEFTPTEVRTMRDFGLDLLDVITGTTKGFAS